LPPLAIVADLSPAQRLWRALWYVPETVDAASFYGRCAALALSVAWGIWCLRQPWQTGTIGMSFLHNIDLPFHEFGHVLFRPFGTWMMFLGGSLFQCLLPLLLGAVFIVQQRQPFSAATCLWWAGENLLDVAPYIGDARSLSLQLIGEATEEIAKARAERHDWHNILGMIGALDHDHALAQTAWTLGASFMLLAWTWGALLLWRQRERLGFSMSD
jgi:hypothetical protein